MNPYRIATIVKVKDGQAWAARMETGVQKFARDTGHQTFLRGPVQSDETLQAQIVDKVVAEGIDALCVVPLFPEALEWNLREVRKKGIVVISNEAPNLRNTDYDLEAFDNTAFGVHLLDHLAAYMGQEGRYAIFLESLTTKAHHEWARAAVARQRATYPQMSLETRKIEHHDDRKLAQNKALELFDNHTRLKGVLALGETGAEAVGNLVKTRKLQERVSVVGTGLLSRSGWHLLEDAIQLLSLWDPADAGYVMNALAVKILNGEAITDGLDFGIDGYRQTRLEGKVLTGSAMLDITENNVASYHF